MSLIRDLPSECVELGKRIDKAREDIVKGKCIKVDVDNLDEMFKL